jgi:hypothetical protein
MAPASVPAMRHSRAVDRASGSSGSPSLVPSKMPATWARRSARPPRQRAQFGQRGRFFLVGERAPPGAMTRFAGDLGDEQTVGISPGTILVH